MLTEPENLSGWISLTGRHRLALFACASCADGPGSEAGVEARKGSAQEEEGLFQNDTVVEDETVQRLYP